MELRARIGRATNIHFHSDTDCIKMDIGQEIWKDTILHTVCYNNSSLSTIRWHLKALEQHTMERIRQTWRGAFIILNLFTNSVISDTSYVLIHQLK